MELQLFIRDGGVSDTVAVDIIFLKLNCYGGYGDIYYPFSAHIMSSDFQLQILLIYLHGHTSLSTYLALEYAKVLIGSRILRIC